MATYIELYDLLSDETFDKRLKFALYVSANKLLRGGGPASAQDEALALRILSDSLELNFRHVKTRILGSPPVSTVGAAVTDTQLQQAVDQIVKELR